MGGGNPVKKVSKSIEKAVDDVGDNIETYTQQTRDEIGRNLGSDAQKGYYAASDILGATGKSAGGAIKETSQGNIGEGARLGVESMFGIPSYKEAGRQVKELLSGGASLPTISTDTGATNAPTPDEAAKDLAGDAAMQEQLASSRRKGRASTILSGPQGLSGSTQYSARRTLLGV